MVDHWGMLGATKITTWKTLALFIGISMKTPIKQKI